MRYVPLLSPAPGAVSDVHAGSQAWWWWWGGGERERIGFVERDVERDGEGEEGWVFVEGWKNAESRAHGTQT